MAVQQKFVQSEQTYRPITFPSSEDDKDVIFNRFSSSFPMAPPSVSPSTPSPLNVSSIQATADQKPVAASPPVELERPTRVAVAMAASSLNDGKPSQFPDEQLEYIRDFSWNLFQVHHTVH